MEAEMNELSDIDGEARTAVAALDLAAIAVLPLTEQRRGTALRDTKSVAERLACSAVALFAVRGYDAVTVQDIAARAGVTGRTFFRYFPTKETVMVDINDQTNLRLVNLIETVDTADDVLATITAAVVEWCSEYQDLHTAITTLTAASQTLAAALLLRATAWEGHLADALERRFPRLEGPSAEVWAMTAMAMLRLIAHRVRGTGTSWAACAQEVFDDLGAVIADCSPESAGHESTGGS